MTFITFVPPIYTNAKNYGALGNGVADDTTAIQNTIAATVGGVVFLPPGTYKITSSLTLSNANTILMGAGLSTWLQPSSGFSGTQVVLCSANGTGVQNMQIGFSNTTYSSNPSANAIQVTGVVGALIKNLFLQYINGWGVQSTATSGQANYNLVCENVHVYSSLRGFHSLGVTGSNFNGVQHFIACNADLIQNGDCYFFEDVEDVLCTSLLGECSSGTSSSIHIKGACAGIYISGLDLGPNPGPVGNVVLIESGANGSPKFIGFSNGIIEGGSNGVYVGAGQQIHFKACEIFNNNGGIVLAGGDAILIEGCTFSFNGQTAGTGRYDINSSTGGNVEILNNHFLTAQGSLTGQTNNVINSTAGQVVVSGNRFAGSGYTSANIFAGLPTIIRGNLGYNPLGSLSPSVPATTVNFALQSVDTTYFVSGGTVSSIKIGGVATGLTSGAFRVPAQQTFNITYTVAPTVTGFGD